MNDEELQAVQLDNEELQEAQQDGEDDEEEEEYYVIPTHPVIMEDLPMHNGIDPCGDPTCPCATLGYPV